MPLLLQAERELISREFGFYIPLAHVSFHDDKVSFYSNWAGLYSDAKNVAPREDNRIFLITFVLYCICQY